MAGVVISKEIGISEDCTGGDDTKQGMLPSKCPHSSFPWTTIQKWSTKSAQFAPDTSSLGMKVGRILFVELYMFSSIE